MQRAHRKLGVGGVDQHGKLDLRGCNGPDVDLSLGKCGERHGGDAGVAAKAFKALSERNINIRAITTSEIKFSVLIDAAYTELAVRTLHSLYGLDK